MSDRISMSLFPVPRPPEGTAPVATFPGVADDFVWFVGDGKLDLVCGECGRPFAQGLDSVAQIGGIVLECPSCGTFNATRQ